MNFSWFKSAENLKGLAGVVTAITAVVALVMSFTKPSGTEQSAKGYELLRDEIQDVRGEVTTVHAALLEQQVWMGIVRDKLNATPATSTSVVPPPKGVTLLSPRALASAHASTSASPLPPPPAIAAVPTPRGLLPDKTDVFK